MYKRMLMLSLGFPARNHYERAAQEAMRRFHWLVLKRVAGILLLLFVAIVVATSQITWFLLGMLLFVFSFFVTLWVFAWWGCSSRDESLSSFVYRSGFSEENAVLCARAGIRPIEVFSDLSEGNHPGAYLLRVEGEWRILIFVRTKYSFTRVERRGVFAHELGHLLLPFDSLAHYIGGSRIFHAREFAADIIGACLLDDARPVLLCLGKFSEAALDLGLPVGASPTHPALADRINQLLDIELEARHAR